ncbi:MAG: hypothetical protein P4M11_10270 [Candidatus Pacebacteria bacterium]|nr:hypothetical protein [Candidatus Paceibacterota bacterium]
MERLFQAFKEREELREQHDRSRRENKEFFASIKGTHISGPNLRIATDDYEASDIEW